MVMDTKTYSKAQEIKLSRALGWKRVSGSGSRPGVPGDIEGPEWLGECKTHMSRTNRVKFCSDVWDKIADEAAAKFKRPALFVDDGSQLLDYTWVLILACDHPGTGIPYPPQSREISQGTDISFVDRSLKTYLHEHDMSLLWESVYLTLEWKDKQFHLMRFSQFNSWFGENR